VNWLLISPILIPLVFGALSLVVWQSRLAQRWLGLIGTGALMLVSFLLLHAVWTQGIVVGYMGAWVAPFGITLVADLLGAIMVVLNGLIGFAVALYSVYTIDARREHFGYYPLVHVLLAGVSGAFLTGDIFNLFVWFEVMLLASFVLLALGGERAQMEGALKYVTLNLFSSMLFLTAVGILYGMAGTLNMADLAQKLPYVERTGLVTTVAMLFMVSFGIKAAAFPLFFWLPASYHTPPVAVSALFAGLLTKVGVYALFRVFTLIFTQDVAYTHTILLVVAAFTMLTGVLGAAAQFEFRRILSFHIVSQIGYMILGLALYTPLAVMGGIFYIMHHIIVKANLFLVSGAAYRLRGTYELRELGSLYRTAPGLSILFLIPAMSLAGMPPLSGFFAKFIIVRAGLEAGQYAVVGVALLVGLLTLFSMVKIWNEAFWKEAPVPARVPPAAVTANPGHLVYYPLLIPIVGLAAITLLIGFWTEPFVVVATRAAEQLLDPGIYIEAVLGARP
jgi:multicomponent Na+:H+ antiporter subunit D